MTRVLILFTTGSVAAGQADPAHLKSLLEAAGDVQVETAAYDDLSYVLSNAAQSITVHSTKRSLDDYDIVYLRRIKESTAQAIAVGKYCQAKGIAVIDREIANRPGSMGKLTQYMQFALAGVSFPSTIYASSHTLLRRQFDVRPFQFPVILKSVSGSRGDDNYLIETVEELDATLAANSNVHFLIQAYVPNTADYRVWVCGKKIGPIVYRSRQSGHKNNTSQGGRAELVVDVLSVDVLDECVRAAELLERDVAGVDVVFENDDLNGKFYFFEVNRAPQIENTPFEDEKAKALVDFMVKIGSDRPHA